MRGAIPGAVLLAMGIAGGCGSDGGAVPDLAAPEGFGASGCAQCVAQTCAGQVADCAADPGCATHWMCTLGCPTGSGGDVDPACAAACPNPSSAEGIAAASALDACRTNDGALGCAACGRVPALLQQQCPPSTETAPCPVCEDNDCCDSYNACQGDPSCMQLKDCAKVCRDYACIYGCTLGAPSDAVVGYSSLLACLTMRCPVCTAGECSCWGTSCAPAYLACRTDAACSLWLFCVRSCSAGDTLCADRCAADQAADVATRFETLLDCSRSRCPECGL